MDHSVIDGDRWIADRLRFLVDLLRSDIPDELRRAIEAEIEALTKEAARHRGRFGLRWLHSGGGDGGSGG